MFGRKETGQPIVFPWSRYLQYLSALTARLIPLQSSLRIAWVQPGSYSILLWRLYLAAFFTWATLSSNTGSNSAYFLSCSYLTWRDAEDSKVRIVSEGSKDKLHRPFFSMAFKQMPGSWHSVVSLLDISYLKPLTHSQTLWLLNVVLSSGARGRASVTSTLICWHTW